MNNPSPSDHPKARSPALMLAAFAAFITAGAVSWATPDGNLVVTLVPTLAVGGVVYGVASWWSPRSRPACPSSAG